jgi:hypothetical protein
MAWGVAGERRPELERDRSSRGGVVRCKGDGETQSAGEVLNEWGEEKKGRKKKGRGVGVVRASWVSHHGNSDVWHYAMSEFQMFSYKKTPLLVQIFRLYIYSNSCVCKFFNLN